MYIHAIFQKEIDPIYREYIPGHLKNRVPKIIGDAHSESIAARYDIFPSPWIEEQKKKVKLYFFRAKGIPLPWQWARHSITLDPREKVRKYSC